MIKANYGNYFFYFSWAYFSLPLHTPTSPLAIVESCLQLPTKVVPSPYLLHTFSVPRSCIGYGRGTEKVRTIIVFGSFLYLESAIMYFRFVCAGGAAWGAEQAGKFKFNNLKDEPKDDCLWRETCIFVLAVIRTRLPDIRQHPAGKQ